MINVPVQTLIPDGRKRNDGKLSIKIRLFYQNGKTKELVYLTLKLYYTKEEWAIIYDLSNQKGSKSIIFGDRLRDERAKITFAQKRLSEIIQSFEDKHMPYSVHDVKAQFESKPIDSITRIYLMNLFDEIVSVKERALKSVSTIESYKNAKKSFYTHISKHQKLKAETFRITSIDARWIEEYKQKMGNQISETTKNDYIISLRAVFNYAIKQKLIDESIYPFNQSEPDNYYNIQTSPKTKKALTLEEFDRLKNVRKDITPAQQEAWDYFMLSYMFNGANLRDIADLKYSDIDHHDNTITFNRKKSSRSKKNDDPIIIAYSAQIQRIIELRANKEESNSDNYIFPIFNGSEKSDAEKTQIVKDKTHLWAKKWSIIAKKAAIRDDLTYQMARHTFATVATQNSVPIEEISKAMGHTSISQTKAYIATLPKNFTPKNEMIKQENIPLDIFNEK
jgi:integrase/recombinase XerD